jgi:hypothetical protein
MHLMHRLTCRVAQALYQLRRSNTLTAGSHTGLAGQWIFKQYVREGIRDGRKRFRARRPPTLASSNDTANVSGSNGGITATGTGDIASSSSTATAASLKLLGANDNANVGGTGNTGIASGANESVQLTGNSSAGDAPGSNNYVTVTGAAARDGPRARPRAPLSL